jgi:hypothetical protein
MTRHPCDPSELDDGVREAVAILWKGGFRTFTSCEGGKGHSFQHETIGMELDGDYAAFQRRLMRFLRSQGMENFTISLVTDYHPEGKRCVYLSGLDILSERKRKQVTALRKFTLNNSDYTAHEEQQDAIESYLRWRNGRRSITTQPWHQFKRKAA